MNKLNIQSVLIVDDSESFRKYFACLLEAFGVEEVSSAESAYEAMGLLERGGYGFQMLFIDLNMPNIDGMEFIRNVEALKFKGHVVFVSGLESSIVHLAEKVATQRSISLLGSLTKPIVEEQLAVLLRRAESLDFRVQLPDNLLKKREFKEAVDHDQVLTYFQPQICYSTKTVLGFECLARLDSNSGIVTPNRFIPVAEKFNLFDGLQQQLLDKSLEKFAYLKQCSKNESLRLSFNLCPVQLEDPGLPDLVESKIEYYNLEKTSIVLEVTETQSLLCKERLETFNRLRIHGFDISLDDFGRGFTNLQQLSDFPFTEVKIDQRFCHGIKHDKVSQIIVSSLLSIAKEKRVEVIAEGVEDGDDLECLVDLGIDRFQGFVFSKPKPFDSIVNWLKAWNKVEEKENKQLV